MTIQTVSEVVGVILLGTVAAAFIAVYFRSNVNRDTVQAAKDTIEILNDRIEAQEGKSKLQDQAIYESEQKILALEAKVKIMKDVPLADIASALKTLADTQSVMQHMVEYFYGNFQSLFPPDSLTRKDRKK